MLDFSLCKNSCHTYEELGQGNIHSFNQEQISFLLSYLPPAHKKNLAYLADS